MTDLILFYRFEFRKRGFYYKVKFFEDGNSDTERLHEIPHSIRQQWAEAMIQNYVNTPDQGENTKMKKLADNKFSERLYEQGWAGANMQFKVNNHAYTGKIGIRIYSKLKWKYSLTRRVYGVHKNKTLLNSIIKSIYLKYPEFHENSLSGESTPHFATIF